MFAYPVYGALTAKSVQNENSKNAKIHVKILMPNMNEMEIPVDKHFPIVTLKKLVINQWCPELNKFMQFAVNHKFDNKRSSSYRNCKWLNETKQIHHYHKYVDKESNGESATKKIIHLSLRLRFFPKKSLIPEISVKAKRFLFEAYQTSGFLQVKSSCVGKKMGNDDDAEKSSDLLDQMIDEFFEIAINDVDYTIGYEVYPIENDIRNYNKLITFGSEGVLFWNNSSNASEKKFLFRWDQLMDINLFGSKFSVYFRLADSSMDQLIGGYSVLKFRVNSDKLAKLFKQNFCSFHEFYTAASELTTEALHTKCNSESAFSGVARASFKARRKQHPAIGDNISVNSSCSSFLFSVISKQSINRAVVCQSRYKSLSLDENINKEFTYKEKFDDWMKKTNSLLSSLNLRETQNDSTSSCQINMKRRSNDSAVDISSIYHQDNFFVNDKHYESSFTINKEVERMLEMEQLQRKLLGKLTEKFDQLAKLNSEEKKIISDKNNSA